ncbi:MAG: hypothetical protein H7A00_09065 [Hahellaceae bacterium]|nr:hypothetical protein [Hahellaceae bacterium]
MLDVDVLVLDIKQLVDERLSLFNLDDSLHRLEIKRLCDGVLFTPAIWASLGVLKRVSLLEYERSILCGLLSALVGQELKYQDRHINSLFFGGVIQGIGVCELGYLFTQSNPLIDNYDNIDANEKLQQTLIVSKMLSNMSSIPEEVKLIVRHRREFCDGTGFPDQLTEEGIADIVQIAILASRLSVKLLQENAFPDAAERLLYEILIDCGVYFKNVQRAFYRVLDRSIIRTELHKYWSSFQIRSILDKLNILKIKWSLVLKIAAEMPMLTHFPEARRLKFYAHQGWYLITTAGIFDDVLIIWLKGLLQLTERDGIPIVFDGAAELTHACDYIESLIISFQRLTVRLIDHRHTVLTKQSISPIRKYIDQLEAVSLSNELDEYLLFSL